MRRRKPAKDQIPQPMVSSDEANSVVAASGSADANVSLNEEGSVSGYPSVATPHGAAEPEEEPRGAHAKKGGLVLPVEQQGAHVMRGDPLLSLERRGLHARKSEALTEGRSESPTVVSPTPVPAGTADQVAAQDDAQATEADSPATKRRTARAKKRKARRSKRQGAHAVAGRALRRR